MKIRELIENFGLEYINVDHALTERSVAGCCIGDLLSSVMAKAQEGDIWLTVQTHENVVAVAVLLNLSGIVFLEGYKPREETIQKAVREGVPLLCTGLSAYEVAGRLYTKGIRRNRQ